MQGIHWWRVNSPHKGPVTRKMFPFDDVIMIFLSNWRQNNNGKTTIAATIQCGVQQIGYEQDRAITNPKRLTVHVRRSLWFAMAHDIPKHSLRLQELWWSLRRATIFCQTATNYNAILPRIRTRRGSPKRSWQCNLGLTDVSEQGH